VTGTRSGCLRPGATNDVFPVLSVASAAGVYEKYSTIVFGLAAAGLLAQRDSGRLELSDLPLSAKVLQSGAFTLMPPIEPPASAKELLSTNNGLEIPPAVRKRIEAFCAAEPKSARHRELRSLIEGALDHDG
jgi:hypothetical protein